MSSPNWPLAGARLGTPDCVVPVPTERRPPNIFWKMGFWGFMNSAAHSRAAWWRAA
jgi:hypothetical protein